MKDGFTGLDLATARRQIEEFFSYGNYIRNKYDKAVYDFFHTLSTSWYSPKAVEFEEKHNTRLCAVSQNLYNAYGNVAASAARSFNILAYSNGSDERFPDDSIYFSNYVGGEYTNIDHSLIGFSLAELKPETDTGSVVMNKGIVSLAKDAFVGTMSQVLEDIDNTPYDIAFYDPNASLLSTYRQEINKIKGQIETVINDAISDISTSIEEEQDTLTVATNQAQSILQG